MRLLALVAIVCTSAAALAQDGGVLPLNPDDSTQLAQLALTGVTSGNWWLLAGVAVMLGVMALRSGAVRGLLPANAAAMLDHPMVAFLLPLLTAAGGGLAVAAMAGPISPPVLVAVLLGALKVSFTSISAYVGGKKIAEAKAAGSDAAAKIDTKADVIAELKAPPAP